VKKIILVHKNSLVKYRSIYSKFVCCFLVPGRMTASFTFDGNLEGSNDLQELKYILEENDLIRSKYPVGESDNQPNLLISSLLGIITHGSDTWRIDSGDFKNMTKYR
jgi:hypothetical protein